MKKLTLSLSLLFLPMIAFAGGSGGLLPKNAVPVKTTQATTVKEKATEAATETTKKFEVPMNSTVTNEKTETPAIPAKAVNDETKRRSRMLPVDRTVTSGEIAKAKQTDAQKKLLRYRSFLK